MYKNKSLQYIQLLSLITASSYGLITYAIEPAEVEIGEMRLYPTLQASIGHNDNILSSETSTQSSLITRINPQFELEAEKENVLFRVNYGFEKGFYHSSSTDNYLDHNLSATANIIGNRKNRIDLLANYRKGHEARGQELGGALSSTSAPIEYDLTNIEGTYTYGGREAKGRINTTLGFEDKTYTNFRTTTRSRDYDKISLGAGFNYKISDKTTALIEIERSDINYDNTDLDSTTQRILSGVTWDATAKTSGTVKLGYQNKDFDNTAYSDTSAGTWNIELLWNPKTYSTFRLSTSQDFTESTTTDTFVDTKNYILGWEHFWNDKLSSNLSYSNTNEKFGNSNRSDDIDVLTLALTHNTKRWLDMGLIFERSERDSNLAGRSSVSNATYFVVDVSL